ALYVLGRLRGSRIGYALEAIRQDEPAARAIGIASTQYKVPMFAFGAALAGLAGALEAHFTFMVAPSGYGFGRVVDMLVYAVVGGDAIFYGPVLGAAFLTALPEALRGAGQAVGLAPGPLRLFVNGAIPLAAVHALAAAVAAAEVAHRVRASARQRLTASRPRRAPGSRVSPRIVALVRRAAEGRDRASARRVAAHPPPRRTDGGHESERGRFGGEADPAARGRRTLGAARRAQRTPRHGSE